MEKRVAAAVEVEREACERIARIADAGGGSARNIADAIAARRPKPTSIDDDKAKRNKESIVRHRLRRAASDPWAIEGSSPLTAQWIEDAPE
jgi:hypothetical protein